MSALLCPKCHTTIDRIARRCPRCGETLSCCRYCAYIDPRQHVCIHPEILEPEQVRDPDEPRECLYYRYKQVKAPRRSTVLGISGFTWGMLIVLLVCGGLLYIGLSQYNIATGPGQTNIELKLQSVGTVDPDEPFDLVFGIYNEGKHPAKHVTIHLGRELLSFAEFQESEPECQEWVEKDDTQFLDFGEVKPGGALLGRMSFMPGKTGTHTVRLVASAENCSKPQTAETRLRITP